MYRLEKVLARDSLNWNLGSRKISSGQVQVMVRFGRATKLVVGDVQVEIAVGIALWVEIEFDITKSNVLKMGCVSIPLVLPIRLETQNDVTRLLQMRWGLDRPVGSTNEWKRKQISWREWSVVWRNVARALQNLHTLLDFFFGLALSVGLSKCLSLWFLPSLRSFFGKLFRQTSALLRVVLPPDEPAITCLPSYPIDFVACLGYQLQTRMSPVILQHKKAQCIVIYGQQK